MRARIQQARKPDREQYLNLSVKPNKSDPKILEAQELPVSWALYTEELSWFEEGGVRHGQGIYRQ